MVHISAGPAQELSVASNSGRAQLGAHMTDARHVVIVESQLSDDARRDPVVLEDEEGSPDCCPIHRDEDRAVG